MNHPKHTNELPFPVARTVFLLRPSTLQTKTQSALPCAPTKDPADPARLIPFVKWLP